MQVLVDLGAHFGGDRVVDQVVEKREKLVQVTFHPHFLRDRFRSVFLRK